MFSIKNNPHYSSINITADYLFVVKKMLLSRKHKDLCISPFLKPIITVPQVVKVAELLKFIKAKSKHK